MLLSKSQRSRETEGVYFDFENPSSVKAALTGVTKVFLIRPPHLADAKSISSLL